MSIQEPLAIGKIVKSNSHVDYVCRLYGPGEHDPLPRAQDTTFGAFVAIRLEAPGAERSELIGLIYTTMLLNPDFGNLGPRLSPVEDVQLFSPDYLSETAVLVGILVVGWLDDAGAAQQGVPPFAPAVNCTVRALTVDEVHDFHAGADGTLGLRYVPLLMAQNDPLAAPLLLNVVDRLRALFPAQQASLAVLRNNIAWKTIVQPSG